MTSVASDNYLTSREWHSAIVGDSQMILRCTSALEFLELFSGYIREQQIDVYAMQLGEYSNINYYIVDTFDNIDYIQLGNVLCTSPSQTFNDMLSNFENIDEQSLIEGLSNYYYANNESFNGLDIWPENIERFNSIRDWAIEYYNEG